jgi:hypothetical protein
MRITSGIWPDTCHLFFCLLAVEEKYEKCRKAFATVLASFNPTGN